MELSSELARNQSATVEYLAQLVETDAALEEASLSPATRQAYARQWTLFAEWCEAARVEQLPTSPATLRAYIAHLSMLAVAPSTMYQATASIRHHHLIEGLPSPTDDPQVKKRLIGHERKSRGRQPKRMPPLLAENLQRIVSIMEADNPENLKDCRDRAVILLGYAGGFRRSELSRIEVEHMTFDSAGLDIYVPWSKADQAGKGAYKYINHGTDARTCPVSAMKTWLRLSGITVGPAFRMVNRWGGIQGSGITPPVIRTIVKDRAEAVGLEDFAAHSLRSGFATQAAMNGVPRHQIKEDGGWSSGAVDAYIRPVENRDQRTSGRIGL